MNRIRTQLNEFYIYKWKKNLLLSLGFPYRFQWEKSRCVRWERVPKETDSRNKFVFIFYGKRFQSFCFETKERQNNFDFRRTPMKVVVSFSYKIKASLIIRK